MRRLLSLLGCLALVLAAAPAASRAATAGHTQTASSGSVTATLTAKPAHYDMARVKLTIERAGAEAFHGRLQPEGCKGACLSMPQPGTLSVQDLDGDGEPEVVFDGFTGGAHCCSVAFVARYVPARGTYRIAQRDFGDLGYRIEDLDGDGVPELETADDRFAYLFTDYADSAFPIQVIRYAHGRFSDVTGERAFRGLVRTDARRLRRGYRSAKRHGRDVRGVLAAYVADEFRLGHAKRAKHVLRSAVRHGVVPRHRSQLMVGPVGRRYERAVLRFLKRAGYRG